VSASALLTGATRHRRTAPRSHALRAGLTMVLLDHDELGRPDGPTRRRGPLGPERWWPTHYRRTDYLDGDADTPLDDAVRELVATRTGRRPWGPVQTLTQVRTHGYVFNPITVHYCLAPRPAGAPAPDRPELEVVVLEVTNTPWHERHCYVVDARPGADPSSAPGPFSVGTLDRRGRLHAEIPKALHVSPFMPMEQTYRLVCTPPGRRLAVHLETFEPPGRAGDEPTRVFDASMALTRRPLTRSSVARALLRRPFPTHRVWFGIHAHAVALAAKRVPFSPHPDRAGPDRPLVGVDSNGKVDR
jgi:DUF1365 family protein